VEADSLDAFAHSEIVLGNADTHPHDFSLKPVAHRERSCGRQPGAVAKAPVGPDLRAVPWLAL